MTAEQKAELRKKIVGSLARAQLERPDAKGERRIELEADALLALYEQRCIEARIDEISPNSKDDSGQSVRINVPQRNHVNSTEYDQGWNACWDAFWTARWGRVGELTARWKSLRFNRPTNQEGR